MRDQIQPFLLNNLSDKKKNGFNQHSIEFNEKYSSEEILNLLNRKDLRYLDLIPRDSLEEKIIYLILDGQIPFSRVRAVFDQIIESINQYSTEGIRIVVFGGGTGLSSILGGDTSLEGWFTSPFDGLKRFFPCLTVSVCVTDDGGSSGRIIRNLPLIAVGDLRCAILSSITPRQLLSRYPQLDREQLEDVAASLKKILNYRFGRSPDPSVLKSPSSLLNSKEYSSIPRALITYLDEMGILTGHQAMLKKISLEDQCLGNLLIVASIFSQQKPANQKNSINKQDFFTPSHREIVKGIQSFAYMIGAGKETIFPACSTQGELQVLYEHGVIIAGENKSSKRKNTFPVHRVWTHFVRKPHVAAKLLEKIKRADLILIAPGSLYTSIIPIFQIPAIAEAVRKNQKALKVLGANFWAQQGETDKSIRRQGKEYYVSDLIEAYHHNIPGGVGGLFDSIIVTDMQTIPGDIIRNYTLEGKVAIYLDKQRVREMGFNTIEADAISEQKLRNEKVIQHDPEKFARIIKTLCYLHQYIKKPPMPLRVHPSLFDPKARFPRKGHLCEYWKETCRKVQQMDIENHRLSNVLLEILWDNREILLDHLSYIQGIKMVRKRRWARSTQWDKILGYYDPEDGFLKIHEQLLNGPEQRLKEDLIIALGESLLGNYFLRKSLREVRDGGEILGKMFEIELRPLKERKCFLKDNELRQYLKLAQLTPSSSDPCLFRMLINNDEAFTPPGLLFGLIYAWYIDNRFGGIMDYEMSLLQWKISELIPKPSMDRTRMKERIEFFRRIVFRQKIPKPSA
jgi:uncharacterized cofD-like protein